MDRETVTYGLMKSAGAFRILAEFTKAGIDDEALKTELGERVTILQLVIKHLDGKLPAEELEKEMDMIDIKGAERNLIEAEKTGTPKIEIEMLKKVIEISKKKIMERS
jgi:hypothetical protein